MHDVAWRRHSNGLTSNGSSLAGGAGAARALREAEGAIERVGGMLGSDDRKVTGDLKRFKEMIEARGTETGAWRGKVD